MLKAKRKEDLDLQHETLWAGPPPLCAFCGGPSSYDAKIDFGLYYTRVYVCTSHFKEYKCKTGPRKGKELIKALKD